MSMVLPRSNPMTVSQKVHLLRCASPFVVAVYSYVRFTPRGLSAQDADSPRSMHGPPVSRALHLHLFAMPSTLMRFSNVTDVD
jgi:hypothetical protein